MTSKPPHPLVLLAARFMKDLVLEEGSDKPADHIMFWSDSQLIANSPQTRVGLAALYATPEDQRLVVEALKAGKIAECYLGWADCRICGARLGTKDLSGYGLVWPEKCEHYLEAHGVWTEGLDRLLKAIKTGQPWRPAQEPRR